MNGAQSSSPEMPRRRLFSFTVLGTATTALTACAPQVTPPGLRASSQQHRLRIALSSMPFTLDPALASDSSAIRILRQCTQTLVGTDSSTGSPTPRLATAFSLSSAGRVLSISLREGVRFHDGSELDAEAVKANFERLYRLPEKIWKRFPRNAFRELFGAHHGEAQLSRYIGCAITGTHSLDLHTSEPMPELVPALSQVGFSIISPAQCARRTKEGAQAPAAPSAFLPSGTGPFTLLQATDHAVRLDPARGRADGAPLITGIDFSVLHQSQARLRSLLRGDADVLDLVTPDMGAPLAKGGQRTFTRDSYAISYLGMNAAHSALGSAKMRSAVAQIVVKSGLLRFHLKGSVAAHSFFPYRLGVDTDYFPDLPTPLPPEDGAALLKAAGYRGEPVRFAYPTGDSSQTLPEPEKIFASLASQLQASGLNIVPVPIPWGPDYLNTVLADKNRALHLNGATGAYIDPGYFVNRLFASPAEEFGFEDDELARLLKKARSTAESDARIEAYKAVNGRLVELVPALPLVNPVNAMAAQSDVSPLTLSPVLDDSFASVSFVQGT